MSERGGALFEFISCVDGAVHSDAISRREEFWFAIQTKPRHEKKVNIELREKGIRSFLPLRREKRRWSDRNKWVEMPMFSQYLFVRLASNGDSRIRVLQTGGVVQFVGANVKGTPIPDEQIESLFAIVTQGIATASHEFLRVGQRVRIRGGALDGIEGILAAIRNEKNLVISVDVIKKSVAIGINGFEVEAV